MIIMVKAVKVKAHDRKTTSGGFQPGAQAVLYGILVRNPKETKELKEGVKQFAPHGIKIIGKFKTLPGRGGPGGRSDVVVEFDSRDIGRLAISPFHLNGGFSWIDDYYDNNKALIPDTALKLFGKNKSNSDSTISKEKFSSYEGVRRSGVTNMFAVNTVQDLSGLSREKIMYIMKNYSNLSKVYPGVVER